MPRQSADSLSVVPAFKIDLQPPAHLGAAAQAVFRDIVAGADRNHFRHEDRELLALYCALAFSDDEIELIADFELLATVCAARLECVEPAPARQKERSTPYQ